MAPTEISDVKQPATIYEDEYIVLDQKKVPQNVIEGIENKMIRMNRRIKKKFGTKEKFDEATGCKKYLLDMAFNAKI